MTLRKRFNNLVKCLIGRTGQKMAIRLSYFYMFGHFPNLKHPTTFNEKINVYKFYTNFDFERFADKVAVRDYVREKIGEKYLIPSFYSGVTLPLKEERTWPLPYIIKMNNCSGWNLFVRNETERNWDRIEKSIATWRYKKFGLDTGELHYQKIKPQVIVEKFLSEDGKTSPHDYKLFVLNGKVAFIQVDVDREHDHKECFYDTDWQLLPFTIGTKEVANMTVPRPKNLSELISLAETLGADFPFARVDFYDFADQIFFGEITFFPSAGFTPFYPNHFDTYYGQQLILPKLL